MSDTYPKSKFMKIVWGFNGIALALILILAIPQAVGEFNRQFMSDSNYQENEKGLIVAKKAEKLVNSISTCNI
ncbi:MAG: hypothetical protein ROO71_04470 [Balneola sp.]